ncbi:hypothetical protein SPAN111604_03475 [Sphingomonas antarctica]|uniref:hypothetical protein n=1 Tax=Sphingomonas antarctica TaxID=2040274 RepID=UPI0039EBA729
MTRVAWLVIAIAAPLTAQTTTIDEASRTTQTIHVSGIAPPACLVRPAGGQRGINATFESTGSSGTVTISNLVDPISAKVLPSRITLTLPITCNSAHIVRLRSAGGALRREGAAVVPGAVFTDTLPYEYGLRWAGGGTLAPTASGQAVTVQASGAASGLAEVTLDVPGGGRPLVAGRYGDTIIVELGAAD